MATDRPAGADGQPAMSDAELERIVRLVSERQSRREQLAIKVGERFLLVQADEVVFASLVDETITVVTDQHRGVSSYRTLDELQERLDSATFWRVHRSHLVNINKCLRIIMPNPDTAHEWLFRPNEYFDGQTAIARMLEGKMSNIYEVRQYLDAQRGG